MCRSRPAISDRSILTVVVDNLAAGRGSGELIRCRLQQAAGSCIVGMPLH